MLCHQNGLGLDIKERANIAGCHSGGYDGTVFPAGQLEKFGATVATIHDYHVL